MLSALKVSGVMLRNVLALGLLATAWNVGTAIASASMVTGGLTSQPIGHYDFCMRYPAECAIHPQDQTPIRAAGRIWREVVAVNLKVNHTVKPMSDMAVYGKDEYWAYPDKGVGDCEDYVLEKRRDLMREGITLADLLITVVRKKDGEGHAVLTVRTDRGDFILDNLTDAVKSWNTTPYIYLKRQATFDTGRWVTIRRGQTTLVSAVR